MKKLRTSTVAKAAAGFATIVCAALVLLCGYVGIALAEESDFYTVDSFEQSSLMRDMVADEVRMMMEDGFHTVSESDLFDAGSDRQQKFIEKYNEADCPIAIKVIDSGGAVILKNYETVSPQFVHDYSYYYAVEPDGGYIYYHLDSDPYDPDYEITYYAYHSDEWLSAEENDIESFDEWLAYHHGIESAEMYAKLVSESDISVSESDMVDVIAAVEAADNGSPWQWWWSGLYNDYQDQIRYEWKTIAPTDCYTIRAAVNPAMTGQAITLGNLDSFTTRQKLGAFAFKHRYDVIWTALLSLIISVLAFIFLCCAVGWKKGNDKPVRGFFERIPLLIYFALCAAVVAAIATLYSGLFDGEDWALIFFALPACAVAGLLMLLSLIRRFKCGEWWKTTLTYGVVNFYRRMAKNWSASWRIIVPAALILLLNGIFALLATASPVFLIVMFTVDIAIFLWLCIIASNWGEVVNKTARLASGDSVSIDTAGLPTVLRTHSENINALGDGVSRAVEQQLRSERMRTDLITNVSHDLKTPLTSIVNYVGLLKGQHIDNPTAEEYIGVLDRQAVRLKHLVEDLVEASKASSGCIHAVLRTVNVREIMGQALSEYSDRLAAHNVEAVLNCPEEGLYATADGNLLWRVFDNLLSNTCKYAQPYTRLYIDAVARDGQAVISFRNTSSQPLNITADELMERFVRGDKSRTTDGSGLGLTIARSLTELQGGIFRLEIDGDLFKAIIALPLAEAECEKPAEEADDPAEIACAESEQLEIAEEIPADIE